MTPFKKIVICGVGLIGGSFALALKKSGFKGKILGLERSPDILERAHALGIVDQTGLSQEETLRDADLIVLSVPVAQTGNALKMILPYWHDVLIVSYTGSTKTDVVAMARDVLGEKIAQFIPAHPIAGSEMNGPEAAVDDLFVGKKAVIAALPENSRADVERLADVWERCGAIIHHLTPENHDTVFATVSHMPHLLAYGLVDYVANHLHQSSPILKEHPDWVTPMYTEDGRLNVRLFDDERLTTWFDTFLPTLDLEKEEVREAMTDSALYWIRHYDFDGFRHDAAKHIPESYWRLLTKKIRKERNWNHLYQIGETYGSVELVRSYVKSGMLDGQFDFNVYHTAVKVFGLDGGDMRVLNTELYKSLDNYGYHNLMGYISGNHDKPRFISVAGGRDGRSTPCRRL